MGGSDESADGPPSAELAPVFDVSEVRQDGETLLYVGQPRVDEDSLERRVWPLFRDRGFEVSLERRSVLPDGLPLSPDEFVLVARPTEPAPGGVPWKNVALFLATVAATLLVGAAEWYHIPVTEEPWRIWEAWPFPAAVLGILGVHEFGHYAMSRYHGVDASLPYFIPFPTLIGTMGAVIRIRGRIPDRRALFDIGAAGPLAGLAATIVVTVVGLQLDPLPAQQAAATAEGAVTIEFGHPLLLEILAALTGTGARLQEGATFHPVVFGGWVGMLVTVLNLLPVGQLDGGHVLRAIVGNRQETIAAAVPGALFALAGYLLFVRDGFDSVFIWGIWGVFSLGLAYAGPATPIEDEPLDRPRVALGILTFVLGALCFTHVPVQIVGP